MWDETLIETKSARKKRSWLTLPVSLSLHAITIIAIIAASYWQIETMAAPQNNIPLIYAQIVSTPAPPIKYAERPSQIKGAKPSDLQQAVIAKEPVTQEQIVPEETPPGEPGEIGDGPGSAEGTPGGSETGSPDGVIGSDGFGANDVGLPTSELPQVLTWEMVKPSLIRKVEPAYPEPARRLRLQGIVILRAIINRAGDVENIEVLQSPHSLFEKPSVEAVRQWKYRPATLNGKPLKVYFTVTVKYTLK